MAKIEIEINGEQELRLRALARDQAISLDELVRHCVDSSLGSPASDRRASYARASALVGAFGDPSRLTDLAAEHDRYLAEPE